jgi:GT2 family glycosyltransferase|tara:strand:- start:8368 stop:9339 length:972 start_codon:yes stop_codon:yes gene_type:complete
MASSVSAGILCFGDRYGYIEMVVRSCVEIGIEHIILFANSCSDDYATHIEHLVSIGLVSTVLRSDDNVGSAAGYSAILANWVENSDNESILLLDDDSVLTPTGEFALDCELIGSASAASVYRPDRMVMRRAVEGVSTDQLYPPVGSALAFDIFHTPRRLFRRTPQQPRDREARAKLLEAPYSGLIIGRDVIEKIGKPNSDYFIYADDTEFTRRIVKHFGPIFILQSLNINDMEPSWNAGMRSNNFLVKLFSSKSDVRAYYSIRNRLFIDKETAANRGKTTYFRFVVNYTIVRMVIYTFLRSEVRKSALRALQDGYHGRLGRTL